jgi:hypothetical protein
MSRRFVSREGFRDHIIFKIIGKAYDPDIWPESYDQYLKRPEIGDTLAKFIIEELLEAVPWEDEAFTADELLAEAHNVVAIAATQLNDVIKIIRSYRLPK